MRSLVRVLPLGLVAVLLSFPPAVLPAEAATTSVSMQGMAFSPNDVTVGQGDTVRWTNMAPVSHTSTSKQGFWGSALVGPSQTYSQTNAFRNAGGYGYYCTVHGLIMSGVVRVPVKASGSPTSGWTLRWSSLTSVPANRSFDVQQKAPGTSTWKPLRTNTTTRTAFVNPTRDGTWRFRARTDNRANGKSSGWSPVRAVVIS